MTTPAPIEPPTLQHLADLSDDELAGAYAPPREPWLRVNFVSTLDGAAQGPDGLSKSINNPVDKRVFDALRTQADCLVVGAGTLRAEGYAVPSLPLVVVSRTGEVPAGLREAPAGRVVMATIGTAPALAATRALLGEDNVWTLDQGTGGAADEVDLAAMKTRMAERGWVNQLCEGGPHLFGSLLGAGVVDELDCTFVPRLIGGGHLRIVAGVEVDVAAEPIALFEQDGTLLGRWLVTSK